MVQERRASVGVTDAVGCLTGVLTYHAFQGLHSSGAELLVQTVQDWLKQSPGPPLANVSYSLDATLRQVAKVLAAADVDQQSHQAFVLNAEGQPVSVLSALDVLQLLSEHSTNWTC
jgi:hypothetical protein